MARITGVRGRDAGLYTRFVFFFTRRGFTEIAGRAPEHMIEPLELYAHVPGLLKAYAGLEQATAKLHYLPQRLRLLAELKAATMTSCEYCIDLGSSIARRSGLTDEQILALADYRSSPQFTSFEKLVLDYAVAMSRTPAEVPDSLFAALREHLDDAQIVELTHIIALENLRGRFNRALGVGAAGFSEGMVCAAPAGAARG